MIDLTRLCDYDKKLILDLGGVEQPDLHWGAAMSVCIEDLSTFGILTGSPNYQLTSEGKKIFELLKKELDNPS